MARLAQGATPFWRGQFRENNECIPDVTFEPHRVFVLMPMGRNDSEEVYQAIKVACRTVDLVATRVDEKAGGRLIMRDVDAMMGHAEFLVFDLSYEKPNVYYELGYAHGIGNHAGNTLLVAKEGTQIHFDIAPLRVQFYRSNDHLQSLVAAQLSEMRRNAAQRTRETRSTKPFSRWKFWKRS